ncbi:MAG: hypothetical protein WCT23_09530 [Candidatus Neomarinimicrobiota bacterium]
MKKSLFLLLLFLSACASLPLLESEDLVDPDSKGRYIFDVKNKIAYKVQHDDDFIYLELKTDDKIAIQKILRHGLYIYLDPKAGRHKDIFFNYPLTRKPGQGEMRPRMGPGNPMNRERSFDLPFMLSSLGSEGLFSKKEMVEKVPVYSESNSFKVEISAPTSVELNYRLRIPLNEIFESRELPQELSMGLMSGKFEIPARAGSADPSAKASRRGGMYSGSRAGGQGLNIFSDDEIQAMSEQISIWFKIII